MAAIPALLVAAVSGLVGVPHPAYLGLFAAAWALFATGGALAAAWLFDVKLARPRRRAITIAVAGAAAAAAAQLGVATWSYLKFGLLEPEMIGASLLIPAPLAALSAAASSWLLTRGLARRLAGAGMAVSLLLLGLLAVADTRGLGDGLQEWSWPLAVTYAAVAAYVGLILVVVARSR